MISLDYARDDSGSWLMLGYGLKLSAITHSTVGWWDESHPILYFLYADGAKPLLLVTNYRIGI